MAEYKLVDTTADFALANIKTCVTTKKHRETTKMTSNLHTHCTFCDGESTPEEIVLAALDKNFCSIGFSSHVNTPFDLRYCMKDAEGYITEISRLKKKYEGEIEIYMGIEEDAHALCDRSQFDYIIGSSHYSVKDGIHLPIDSSRDYFDACLEAWKHEYLDFAEDYFSFFCDYIAKRRPDIIGHYDLITKFDEKYPPIFLGNPKYHAMAKNFTEKIADLGVIFEINTGAMSRSFRTTPYPYVDLLHLIKKHGGKITLSSDSHAKETLDYGFEDAKMLLRDVGFDESFVLYHKKFTAVPL